MNNRTNVSRRGRDDLRAKAEEEEVLKEFVAAFEEPASKTTKTFIKGGVFNPGSHEETPIDRGKSYRASTTKSSRTSESSHESFYQQTGRTSSSNEHQSVRNETLRKIQ